MASVSPRPVHSQHVSGRDPTEELVLSAAAGNTAAFHRLADRYQDSVFRMVYHRIRSRMDAEDITQDVFLTAFRQLPRLKARAKFRSWLFSIALNRVRDFRRKQKLRRFFGLASTASANPDAIDPMAGDGYAALARRQFWHSVETILKRMSVNEREVFMLRFFDQLGIAEMARVLDKGESTVKTHLYRAIAKFKAHPAAAELMEDLR